MSKQSKELRALGDSELKAKIIELSKEMIKINAQVATGTVPKNPYQIKNSKRTIARIHTIQREKELRAAVESAKKVNKQAKANTGEKKV